MSLNRYECIEVYKYTISKFVKAGVMTIIIPTFMLFKYSIAPYKASWKSCTFYTQIHTHIFTHKTYLHTIYLHKNTKH
jgi:hypothetical protein